MRKHKQFEMFYLSSLVIAAMFTYSLRIIVYAVEQLPPPSEIDIVEIADVDPEPLTDILPEETLEPQIIVIETPAPVPTPEPEPEWECPISDSEVDLIANLVYAEAGNQSEYGQRLVIDTVLNRMDSERFPNTVEDVLYQPNQYYTKGHSVYGQSPYEDLRNLVIDELKERTNYDVFYFRTKHYHAFGTPLFREGAHYFSK